MKTKSLLFAPAIACFFLILVVMSCSTINRDKNYSQTCNFLSGGKSVFVAVNSVGDTAMLTISLTNHKRIDGMIYKVFRSHISFPHPPTDTFFQALAGFNGKGYLRTAGSKTYFLAEHYKVFRSKKATEYVRENFGGECMWHDWEQTEGASWQFKGVFPFADGWVRIEKSDMKQDMPHMRLRFSNSGSLHHMPYVRYAELSKGTGLTSLSFWHPMLGRYLHFKRR